VGILSAIAYEIARGAVRAYFDALAESARVTVEEPQPADRVRADRLRDAVRLLAKAADDARPHDPAPNRETGTGDDLGSAT
jgi:hypothetical protein